MFQWCFKFNQPLHNWDVSNVEYIPNMFYYCTNFNQDLSNWKLPFACDARHAFDNCPIKPEYKPKFN